MIQQIIFEILLGVLVCCIIVDIAIVKIVNDEIKKLQNNQKKARGKHEKNKNK